MVAIADFVILKTEPLRFVFGLLITGFLVVSESSHAEWIKVTSDPTIGMTTYVDPSSIYKEIELVKVSTLDDFISSHGMAGQQYLSRRADLYLNCKDAKERLIDLTLYTERMGKGKAVLSANGPVTWSPVSARNVGSAMLNYVCNGKSR